MWRDFFLYLHLVQGWTCVSFLFTARLLYTQNKTVCNAAYFLLPYWPIKSVNVPILPKQGQVQTRLRMSACAWVYSWISINQTTPGEKKSSVMSVQLTEVVFVINNELLFYGCTKQNVVRGVSSHQGVGFQGMYYQHLSIPSSQTTYLCFLLVVIHQLILCLLPEFL